jgi:hypothetical protein
MDAMAGTNPEAAAVTKVIFPDAKQAAQAGPVGLGHGEMGGEGALAGLVEGLGEWDGHDVFPDISSCSA